MSRSASMNKTGACNTKNKIKLTNPNSQSLCDSRALCFLWHKQGRREGRLERLPGSQHRNKNIEIKLESHTRMGSNINKINFNIKSGNRFDKHIMVA